VEDRAYLRRFAIIRRGQAGGLTFFVPGEPNGLYSRSYLENQMAVALGGRVMNFQLHGLQVAEEVITCFSSLTLTLQTVACSVSSVAVLIATGI
jgi:ATP-dependent Zn protease